MGKLCLLCFASSLFLLASCADALFFYHNWLSGRYPFAILDALAGLGCCGLSLWLWQRFKEELYLFSGGGR